VSYSLYGLASIQVISDNVGSSPTMTPIFRSNMSNADDEYKGLWITAPMTCVICGHKWIAVAPMCASTLDCPECEFPNEAPELDDD
jgi:hypothetical protein